jgi:predicted nucleic acid-binding protein
VALILVDSTVIVGFLDADDALHGAAVARLEETLGRGQLVAAMVASIISYAELMTSVALGYHAQEYVEGFFDALVKDILPVDRSIVAGAAELRRQHQSLTISDALVLATADTKAEIEAVLCADAAWPKISGLACQVELLQA